MVISASEIMSSSTTFVLTVSSFPAYVTTAEIPNETDLFTLSRELAARANGLQDQDRKATTLMKVDLMQEV